MQDSPQSASNFDDFSELKIDIEARLDEKYLTLKDAMQLRPGFVLALSRPAGNTIDMFVGNVRFASAEVICLDDTLALRITEFHFQA